MMSAWAPVTCRGTAAGAVAGAVAGTVAGAVAGATAAAGEVPAAGVAALARAAMSRGLGAGRAGVVCSVIAASSSAVRGNKKPLAPDGDRGERAGSWRSATYALSKYENQAAVHVPHHTSMSGSVQMCLR
jgi:hypothetical protein